MAATFTLTNYYLEGLENETDYVYPTDESSYCYSEESVQWIFYGVFQGLLYSLIFLLGVAGNGLMITVLLRRWRLLRIAEIYLLHLALADLLLLFTFPFDVIESATGWVFGNFLCKLMGLGKHLNLLCGSLLLACIGFDRYLAIVHAINSMQSRRRRTVHLTCTLLWLVCLSLSVPNVVFLTVTEEATNTSSPVLSCFFNQYGIHANNWDLAIRVLDHVCFFLPLAVMSYCYTAVIVTLLKSQKSQAKQGAIRLALLITLIFCFCWLPYNVTLLIKTMADLKLIKYKSCYSYLLLQPVLNVTKGLGFSHCCLNPILYAFVGVRFRNELIQIFCKLGCSRVCMPFIRTRVHSRSSNSEGTTTSVVLI
uniref:C-X-C chemokine receptor type 5 n=1 Tax=Scatophagus argus TaxID=75038 RepID=UPI001ED83A73|nr:C-X-C chemokine receptor type 5 [Scatophagus argus]XP_046245736.1 C-X-C chemokine receptor type 5 [Scatophagus argus]XP_046245737.1 C-X-C chemokine receptor type 5 [Scatophagus argus]